MQLEDLKDVVAAPGPVATVYIDTSRDSEDGARLVEGRWRALRGQLAEAGCDEETLAALDEVVGADLSVAGRHGQALVAAGGRVLLAEDLPRPPRREIAHVSQLPHLMPLVAQRTDVVPHVVVVADRRGADVTVVGPHGEARADEVTGPEQAFLQKVHAGGWSYRRYEQNVMDNWEKNGKEVAERVDQEVRRTGAGVVVLAGDVRAVDAIVHHLGHAAAGRVVRVTEGGRAAGSDAQVLQEKVDEIVSRAAADQVMATADRFREERGEHRRAVEGLEATVEALRKAQVETLLLNDDPSSTATLWTAAEPTLLGTARSDVESLGADGVLEERADAVLVRALVGTDAGLVVVPQGEVDLRDGVGAVLRYADASTPS